MIFDAMGELMYRSRILEMAWEIVNERGDIGDFFKRIDKQESN